MSAPLHFGPQRLGETLTYAVDHNTLAGVDAPLTGDETLAAAIWPAGGGDTIATPAVTVVDGDAHFTVDADPAAFAAGVYRVDLSIDDVPSLPVEAFLTLLPRAGAGEALPGGPAKSVTSSGSPYCTVADFLAFYDANFVGQYAMDDGTVADAEGLEFSDALGRILQAASGRVEAAVLAGRRHSVADLQVLCASGGNGAARLAELVAHLAAAALRRRRGVPDELTPAERDAEASIEQIRAGARILPFAESADAGRPASAALTARDLRALNLVSGETRYFGRRQRSRRGC